MAPPVVLIPDSQDSHALNEIYHYDDPSSQFIYIAELNVDASSVLATTFGKKTVVPSTCDATVQVSTPVATAQSLFRFSTDSLDVNDMSANDMLYKVVYANCPTHPLSLNFDSSSVVIDKSIIPSTVVNGITPNQNLTYDFLRYLAKSLFGTATAVDLFNNEVAVRTSLDLSISHSLNDVLNKLVSNGVLTANDTSKPNPSKTILEHLLASANGRFEYLDQFVDTTLGAYDASGWYYMPLSPGDKLYFTVNVKTDPKQNDLTHAEELIADRKYLVEMVLTNN